MNRGNLPSSGDQLNLPLRPVKEAEIEGIQMGVLSDGTPYLTMRGLAMMCGVAPSVIQGLASNWQMEKHRPRGRKIQESLVAQGYTNKDLIVRIWGVGGENHAYTGSVCMAILEYYALDATGTGNQNKARESYRILARDSFTRFIYEKTGYNPQQQLNPSFISYQERVMLNDQLPANYFSVFREVADLIIHLINGGLPIDDTTMPDNSVGQIWGRYWEDNGLEKKYGPRVRYDHTFPGNYRQSIANSFVKPWIYPIEALGVFRKWLYANYSIENLPGYLKRKKFNNINELLEAVRRPELPNKH
ncbi:hypothetical protein ONR67_06870 [Proteus terrae]|uniref:hypothetical protein n=1 Tax=Proteus terrae TaxID=1574161 RepID=UPI00232BE59A|nr:hypothetical protein [Proteus terrae]WCG91738.1 hypothetical protein ONR67_06870 [Proteus terrae]